METIEKVLEKIKIFRKDKGFSHENMALELGISQAAYTNIEKNESKLTVERLIRISEILEKPLYQFFDVLASNVYNQQFSDYFIFHQHQEIENLYQENKEVTARLEASYQSAINSLKEEVSFLRNLLDIKGK